MRKDFSHKFQVKNYIKLAEGSTEGTVVSVQNQSLCSHVMYNDSIDLNAGIHHIV